MTMKFAFKNSTTFIVNGRQTEETIFELTSFSHQSKLDCVRYIKL
jgi:hypothetical protein